MKALLQKAWTNKEKMQEKRKFLWTTNIPQRSPSLSSPDHFPIASLCLPHELWIVSSLPHVSCHFHVFRPPPFQCYLPPPTERKVNWKLFIIALVHLVLPKSLFLSPNASHTHHLRQDQSSSSYIPQQQQQQKQRLPFFLYGANLRGDFFFSDLVQFDLVRKCTV